MLHFLLEPVICNGKQQQIRTYYTVNNQIFFLHSWLAVENQNYPIYLVPFIPSVLSKPSLWVMGRGSEDKYSTQDSVQGEESIDTNFKIRFAKVF